MRKERRWEPRKQDFCCGHVGFLQKNNSLEESGRMRRSEGAAKTLLSWDHGDPRLTRTETDFSNMFARGRRHGFAHASDGYSFLFEEWEITMRQKRSLFL